MLVVNITMAKKPPEGIDGNTLKNMSKRNIEIVTFRDSRPYILWRRVSTGRQGESGLGLAAQETIANMFMGRKPVEIYTDVHTGTNLKQCDALWQAIDCCKKNGYILVVAKTDRFRSVQDALLVLDTMGQDNVIFCDLPSTDRFVLTIMWAVWEKHAIMGRLNTRMALAERKRQIEKDGGFMSKSGHWRKHLGNEKGVDVSAATAVQARIKADDARAWRESNDGYRWIKKQVQKGRLQKDILREFNEFHEMGLAGFSTREGCKMNACTLSKWIQEIRRQN